MEGNDFVWLASIILGMTVLGWLVLDWLESAQQWDDTDITTSGTLGSSEQRTPDALDVETELMLCYPLDPFAPALLWRPQPQDEWIEVQESKTTESVADTAAEASPAHRPSEAA